MLIFIFAAYAHAAIHIRFSCRYAEFFVIRFAATLELRHMTLYAALFTPLIFFLPPRGFTILCLPLRCQPLLIIAASDAAMLSFAISLMAYTGEGRYQGRQRRQCRQTSTRSLLLMPLYISFSFFSMPMPSPLVADVADYFSFH